MTARRRNLPPSGGRGSQLTDLGLAPVSSASVTTPATTRSNDDNAALAPGSMLARVLWHTWRGDPITVVDSPPGTGKSTLIVQTVCHLLRRTDLTIVVATPTRRSATDLATRLAAELGTGEDGPRVLLQLSGKPDLPHGVHASLGAAALRRRFVVVRTVASCSFGPPECDVMVVDEAYQTTFADVSTAADRSDQVLLVGDPGQIGPVITTNTRSWSHMKAAPHMRAPEVFTQDPEAVVLQLDATYRLGKAAVDAIAPLYGFGFTSKRPGRVLLDETGQASPELAHSLIEPAASTSDIEPMLYVADQVKAMVGETVATTEADGTTTTHRLGEEDVAVVVSHNVQASGIGAMLRSAGFPNVTVGTADRMQGGQWHAVVALDPMVGHAEATSHQLAPGRLCVMASRHLTHLLWVHDGGWEAALRVVADESDNAGGASLGIAVRRHLASGAPA